MKVLWITNLPSPYRVQFFNELSKYCNLLVLFERHSASDRHNKWSSENTYNFNYKVLNGTPTSHETAVCPSVLRYITRNKYDIVVITNYYSPTGMLAILKMKLLKIPFYIEADGGFKKQDSRLKYLVKNYFIKSASGWFSTSKKTDEYFLFYGAKKEKIYRYPFSSINDSDICTIEEIKYSKNYYKEKINHSNERIILGVGQFIHRKGFDMLLEAYSKISTPCVLILVGCGDKENEYRDLIDKNNLAGVYIEPFKDAKELVDYYRAADIFVLPTREDIWGLVVNEAMAYGLPVITTDRCVAGLELIEHGKNGFICSLNNISDSLPAFLDRLLSEEKLCAEISQSNINKIREYTIQKMARSHADIFSRINS